MRSLLSRLAIAAMSFSLLSPITITQATASSSLVTCIKLQSGAERISRSDKCRIGQEAQANWEQAPSDSALSTEPTGKTITICSNKPSSTVSYRIIRAKCARHQVSTLYTRSASLASTPIIASAIARGYNSASLMLTEDPGANLDAPIAFYTVTSSKGESQDIYSWQSLSLVINKLNPLTTYTFTVTATTADGRSSSSEASMPVTTPAYVAPSSAATPTPTSTATPLAAPAFTLSAIAETRTVNTAATGFTISSTGGTIASFAINATPAGMSFSTSTGALSGTPNTVAGATTYTVTATNASGSATQTFVLTVIAAVVYTVGSTGPGGGTIFYVATTPFVCGPTRSATCTYLEAAPSGWNVGADPTQRWANTTNQSTAVINATSPETATATAIGWGYRNTRAIILQGNSDTATSAAALADSHTVTVSGVAYDDWYLPSKGELNQMCKWQRGQAWTSDATVCDSTGSLNSATYGAGAAGFVAHIYWSSSEYGAALAFYQDFGTGYQGWNGDKNVAAWVRPVRAF